MRTIAGRALFLHPLSGKRQSKGDPVRLGRQGPIGRAKTRLSKGLPGIRGCIDRPKDPRNDPAFRGPARPDMMQGSEISYEIAIRTFCLPDGGTPCYVHGLFLYEERSAHGDITGRASPPGPGPPRPIDRSPLAGAAKEGRARKTHHRPAQPGRLAGRDRHEPGGDAAADADPRQNHPRQARPCGARGISGAPGQPAERGDVRGHRRNEKGRSQGDRPGDEARERDGPLSRLLSERRGQADRAGPAGLASGAARARGAGDDGRDGNGAASV